MLSLFVSVDSNQKQILCSVKGAIRVLAGMCVHIVCASKQGQHDFYRKCVSPKESTNLYHDKLLYSLNAMERFERFEESLGLCCL